MEKKPFFGRFENKRIAICGIGVSNTPLIEKFIENKAVVTLCDRRLNYFKDNLPIKNGEDYLKNIDADIIFRTPGINFLSPELMEYRKKGIAVTSEMEMFFEFCPCKIIAVTGSNGKTTTTTLISEMLRKKGRKIWLGGNIGKALLPFIDEISTDDIAVVELSSFQLISMRKSPDIAVITNISPNHLDVHRDMREYIDSKKNIFLHQNAFSKTILNADNETTAGFSDEVRGQTLFFSRKHRPEHGSFIDEKGDIFMDDSFVMNRSEIKLPGNHNIENYLAAICAVWGMADAEHIREVAREFGGVEHRAELVRDYRGIRFFNDSIATSPSRTIQGMLSLFDEKIILIAGGYDKKIPFNELAEAVIEKVKIIILMGDTAQSIKSCILNSPNYKSEPKIITVDNMEQAIKRAVENARSDDIVALSPACASFDKYKNFEERGEHFRLLVKKL